MNLNHIVSLIAIALERIDINLQCIVLFVYVWVLIYKPNRQTTFFILELRGAAFTKSCITGPDVRTAEVQNNSLTYLVCRNAISEEWCVS